MRPGRAEFVMSGSSPATFAPEDLPEIAFAGRSNVGKSSLINAYTGVKGLARTSNTPGRTRLINWFRVEAQGRRYALVDLPGYGFAKVSKSMRASWQPLVEAYLKRGVLRLVVLLIDLRRGVEAEERELIDWLGHLKIPVQIALTKVDKLPKSRRKPAAKAIADDLGLRRIPILCSTKSGDGIQELRNAILAVL